LVVVEGQADDVAGEEGDIGQEMAGQPSEIVVGG
jgi:hypothetical protein